MTFSKVQNPQSQTGADSLGADYVPWPWPLPAGAKYVPDSFADLAGKVSAGVW